MNNTHISIDLLESRRARFYDALIGMGYKNPLITLTSLQLHANLDVTKNSYTLKLKENSGSDGVNENKLGDSEYAFPIAVALGIQKYETDAAGNAQDGNFPLFTYPDPNYFVGASGGSLETDALRLIYGGKLIFKQGGTELIKKMKTNRLGYTPDGQYLLPAASGNTNPMLPQYGPSFKERGYGLLYSDFILKGDNDNQVILDLGAGKNTIIDGSVDAAGNAVSTRNRVIVDILSFVFHQDLPESNGNTGKFCII